MKRVQDATPLGLALIVCVLQTGPAAAGDIENNLSSYTGVNAQGYLEPLKDAVGTALNTGLYSSGHVPRVGFGARIELRGMLVSFADEDKTFQATTEDYFPAQITTDAPTVVGDGEAVTVTDSGPGGSGASFSFPGGFDLDRFALAAPQLVVGNVMGTEAMLRYFAIDTGDEEIGDISLFGLGLRHSISQYFPTLPVNVSALGFWQNFELGDDLIDASAFTIGVQGSKRFSLFEPYVGLSMDSFQMDVKYETDISGSTETINVEFDRDSSAHLTLGSALHLGFLHLNGELNVADQTAFTFGFGLGL